MNKTIINFCPTGMVPTKAITEHVPVQINEIIEQTHEANEIGITIAHLHARNLDETPAYSIKVYQKIFKGIRKHYPGLVLCGTTSGRTHPKFEHRSQVIELQPDMCSLTLSSLNFYSQAPVNNPNIIQQLALKMKEYGVVPKLECFDLGIINYGKYLISKGIIVGPFYWNILLNNIAGIQSNLSQIGAAVDSLPSKQYVSLAGLGKDQLKINTIAIASNLGVRIGLEDNIWYNEARTKQATNFDLLKRIHLLLDIFEKKYMPSKEFGQLGFYNRPKV